MNDIIGQKVASDYDAEDLTDRDLASPQFTSWTARREATLLRDTVRTLGMTQLLPKAEMALSLICEIDDVLGGSDHG